LNESLVACHSQEAEAPELELKGTAAGTSYNFEDVA